jgi:hypothetical protein
MGSNKSAARRIQASARRVLWGDRALILPHLLHDHSCGVAGRVQEVCELAGWTYDSYYLAIFFDHKDLITEVEEGR